MYTPKNIAPYEIVDKATFDKYGSFSYTFIDERILRLAQWLREQLGEVACNDWYWGGKYDSRGFRQSTNDDHSPYSPHARGTALDLKFTNFKSSYVREYIEKHWEDIKKVTGLTCLKIERNKKGVPITWVHIHTGNYEEGLHYFDL